MIADFTTLLLLEIDCEGNPTFAELLDRIQKQLHEDMKYTAYSGVTSPERPCTDVWRRMGSGAGCFCLQSGNAVGK